MHRLSRRGLPLALTTLALALLPGSPSTAAAQGKEPAPTPALLTDPFLQLPTTHGVRVVWMTEFRGWKHQVVYGRALAKVDGDAEADVPWLRVARAHTQKLSRLREDASSNVPGRTYTEETTRQVWRHEAVVRGLTPGVRVPYRVVSGGPGGQLVWSDVFTLGAAPPADQPLKILLTSDHQLKANTPANLQMVEQTVGRVDAVFLAGDLINIPDRASEWFDDGGGLAFFPGLQGRTRFGIEDASGATTEYRGGQLIQHAPLFPVIGNHEVMGRVSERDLGGEFNDPKPRAVAERAYGAVAADVNPRDLPWLRARWVADHSFNTDTYEEIFSLPDESPGGERYYAVTVGNVRLIALYATRIWRSGSTDPTGATKYVEAETALDDELERGWGTHIFERIDVGSAQYGWLERELSSRAFREADYQVVMLHHPVHNLGGNVVPAFTDPVRIEERDEAGNLVRVRYEYPRADDYLLRDIEPLLTEAGVDLVHNGHSHLFNRFQHPTGTHYLETSNVGNNYGAFLEQSGASRTVPGEPWNPDDYVAQGDPGQLEPIVPTIEPLLDPDGVPYPFLASNDFTAFSILDTGTGEVTTYLFDVRNPQNGVREFDRFRLGE